MSARTMRRSIDELHDRPDLVSGDGRAKRSAFWTMLSLLAMIAAAGVAMDSTATVVGALSTPIYGVALGFARGVRPLGSTRRTGRCRRRRCADGVDLPAPTRSPRSPPGSPGRSR
ncbi:hypothetical protein JDV09_25165 [Mycobacterium sp. Y57]|uniref:hypothetical protein n=1 Tax=Mycolicibacterium xanthum TaxID=2796469 RepID=UPI001C8619CB|nr:hypothetical protein [Mycolicibacterium xanthum]MBX7435366.1 hypothetical protein [Mycolicibacterium xanthum]